MKNFESFWLGKKIIITGHTGFKGSWLAVLLKFLGSNIVGISDERKQGIYLLSNVSSLLDKEHFLDLSSENNTKLIKIFDDFKPDLVFHFAAQSLVISGYKNPHKTIKDNLLSSLNIFEANSLSNPQGTVIVSTTDKVYKKSDIPNLEVSELGGKDIYSFSKVSIEQLIETYKYLKPELKISVIRSGNVIGGGDRGEARLVPDIISAIQKNEVLTLRNPGSIRPWLHILDSLYGYLLLAEYTYSNSKAGVYNLSSQENNKLKAKEIAELFQEFGNKELKIKTSTNKQFEEVSELRIDSNKAEKDLGWLAKFNIETCVKLTLDWEENIKKDKHYSEKQIEDFLNLN